MARCGYLDLSLFGGVWGLAEHVRKEEGKEKCEKRELVFHVREVVNLNCIYSGIYTRNDIDNKSILSYLLEINPFISANNLFSCLRSQKSKLNAKIVIQESST